MYAYAATLMEGEGRENTASRPWPGPDGGTVWTLIRITIPPGEETIPSKDHDILTVNTGW